MNNTNAKRTSAAGRRYGGRPNPPSSRLDSPPYRPAKRRRRRKSTFKKAVPFAMIAGAMMLSLLIVNSEFTAAPLSKPVQTMGVTVRGDQEYIESDEGVGALAEQAQGNEDPYLILVNQDHTLEKDYKPSNLVDIQKQVPSLSHEIKLERSAANAYKAMLEEMEAQQVTGLIAVSGYRTYEYQENLFRKQVEGNMKTMSREAAEKEAATLVAIPGSSEHQAGLAIDVSTVSMDYKLSERFTQTECYAWLKENCASFGFIIRYPEDKINLTGISHEPWHLRYVGVEHARTIMSRGICLEEYVAGKNR